MSPAPGDMLLFSLAKLQAEHVNRVRIPWLNAPSKPKDWPTGAQAHMGKPVHEGQVLPLLVIEARGDNVDGKVQLPGSDVMWVEQVPRGDGPGQWRPR